MDCEIKKIKHVYHSLNGVSSTIDVFVQLKPALAGQVLYMYIYNSTTYYINVIIYSSTETDIGDNESGYEYSSGEITETSSETAWTSNAYCSEC